MSDNLDKFIVFAGDLKDQFHDEQAEKERELEALRNEIFERFVKYSERYNSPVVTVAGIRKIFKFKYDKTVIQAVLRDMADAGIAERVYPDPHTTGPKTMRYKYVG